MEDEMREKTINIAKNTLQEYWVIRDLEEALKCISEVQARYRREVIKSMISLYFDQTVSILGVFVILIVHRS